MTDKYLDILREYWGYSDFRGIQREIIESIGAGRDTLGLMPGAQRCKAWREIHGLSLCRSSFDD